MNANSQVLVGGSANTQITLFSAGRIYFKTETDALYLSATSTVPATGQFNYKIIRVGSDVTFYVDNVEVDSITGYSGNLECLTVGSKSSSYFSGEIDNLVIGTETFTFSEGSGSITQGNLGTIFTLQSTNNVEDMWIPE